MAPVTSTGPCVGRCWTTLWGRSTWTCPLPWCHEAPPQLSRAVPGSLLAPEHWGGGLAGAEPPGHSVLLGWTRRPAPPSGLRGSDWCDASWQQAPGRAEGEPPEQLRHLPRAATDGRERGGVAWGVGVLCVCTRVCVADAGPWPLALPWPLSGLQVAWAVGCLQHSGLLPVGQCPLSPLARGEEQACRWAAPLSLAPLQGVGLQV